MPSDSATAIDLIDEARFARRMVQICDASLVKIESALSIQAQQPVRRHLDVPTVNAEGWSEPVLYVIRGERAKGAKISEIAETLERMFDVQVTSQVLLAAVLHFDLDRRVAVQGEPEVPPAVQDFVVAPVVVETVVDVAPCEPNPVVSHEPAPVEDNTDWEAEARRLYAHGNGMMPFDIAKKLNKEVRAVCCAVLPGFKEKQDKRLAKKAAATKEPVVLAQPPKPIASAPGSPAWAHEAIRLHNNGLTPGAIARRLKDQGASDYLVRCLVIPGFRDEMQAKVRRLRGQGEYAGEKKPAPAKAPAAPVALPPKPQPREPKTKPAPKPVERKAVSKQPPAPLPWSPPPRRIADASAEVPVEGKGVHLLDLQAHSCRWPMGRGADGHETYCGCQVSIHGGSYCEEHAIRAHTPGCWPPRTPAQKRPTRMARSMSALPEAQPNRRRV